MLIHKASEQSERRIATAVGIVVVFCAAAAALFAYLDPFGGRGKNQIDIVIESSYGGRGVKDGTALLMHGVQVGEVTSVTSLPGGAVRVAAVMDRGPAARLTDTMGIDFRAANYFGVTGINLRPGTGGQALTNGSFIKTTPAGNFTLQVLLSQLGEISHGVLTPHLIEVIDKATSYTDGLDPLIETVLFASETLAHVQTVSTARLLTNTTGISVAFPGFISAATNLGESVHQPLTGHSKDWYDNLVGPTIDLVSSHFFGAVGHLESSHSTDLAPLTDMVKTLTDVVPGILPPDSIADTARELRTLLERIFSGPPDRRAVNVRVVLDSLPGVAAPLAAIGGAP